MKKNIVLALTFYFLAGLLLAVTPSKAFAEQRGCGLTVEPSAVPRNYKGVLTITSEKKGCFSEVKESDLVLNKSNNTGSNDRYSVGNDGSGFTIIEGSILKFKTYKDVRILPDDIILRLDEEGPWTLYLCKRDGGHDNCNTNNVNYFGSIDLVVGVDLPPDEYTLPKLNRLAQTKCAYQINNDVELTVADLEVGKGYRWWLVDRDNDHETVITESAATTSETFSLSADAFSDTGTQTVCVDRAGIDQKRHETQENCILLTFSIVPPGDTACSDSGPIFPDAKPPCANNIEASEDNPNGGCTSVNSAFGPLSTEPGTFIPRILAIFLSLSGGIALLLIIRSGYQLLTSQGDAEKVKEARERITSAIIGILFMIFSLVVLQTIGVDILHLPGFGK